VKEAAATVPVVEGRVTPPAPPVVRVPAGANTTVPAVAAETATLPKFKSAVLVIVIGVMMVAEAAAVAVACAKETLVPAMMMAAVANNLVKFFILSYLNFEFLSFEFFKNLFDL
jgi:hypothetical protein